MTADQASTGARRFGMPRIHHRATDSTNLRARELAAAGVPDGTVVTASEQSAGRGRQGRVWTAPPGRALLYSVVVRQPPRLLPLAAGAAVAEVAAAHTAGQVAMKWPNDIHLDGRKVSGILVEGRPHEGWAVVGVGLNVAVRPQDFPAELRDTATTLGLEPDAIEPIVEELTAALARWIAAPADAVLGAIRARDALLGRPVRWAGGEGTGAGIDDDGCLVVDGPGGRTALNAGEVHLGAVR